MNHRRDLQNIARMAEEIRARRYLQDVLKKVEAQQSQPAARRQRRAPQVMTNGQALIGFAALGWFLWWAFTTGQTNPAAQLWAGFKWLLGF